MSALARNTDSSTSHEAAAYIVSNGTLQAQQEATAAAVRLHPGLTSLELAEVTKRCRYMLARRLPELLEDGRAWKGPKKPCRISGRSAHTWWPVAPGDNLELAV